MLDPDPIPMSRIDIHGIRGPIRTCLSVKESPPGTTLNRCIVALRWEDTRCYLLVGGLGDAFYIVKGFLGLQAGAILTSGQDEWQGLLWIPRHPPDVRTLRRRERVHMQYREWTVHRTRLRPHSGHALSTPWLQDVGFLFTDDRVRPWWTLQCRTPYQ